MKLLSTLGKSVAIFLCQGHAFLFLLFAFFGLISQFPGTNLFSGKALHQGLLGLSLAGGLLWFAFCIEGRSRLKVVTWLGGASAYSWVAASAILRPVPEALWSRGRDVLDQIILAPLVLWTVLAGAMVVGLFGFWLIQVVVKLKSRT